MIETFTVIETWYHLQRQEETGHKKMHWSGSKCQSLGIAAFFKLIKDNIKILLYIIVIKRYYCRILNKDDLQSKIMNSRLFHLQGIGCKIVNCT